MKILVTGGAGYIGSHTCVELLNQGYEVIIVDNFSNSHREVINRIKQITNSTLTLYDTDMLDGKALRKVFMTEKIDGVIHFAGYKAVGESVENPLMYYQNNLMSTVNLLNLMNEFAIHHLVFSSSATVYGNNQQVPLSENLPLGALNPYGRTKWMIEEILRDVCVANSQMNITLLRYFNPIGAHESGLIGEDPNGVPNNLVPYITQVAAGKLECLQVFGGDYPTIDGTGVRDYIHVVDLAIGHIKAIEQNILQSGIEVFNLGTGRGTSVLEMVQCFEQVIGNEIPYKLINRRAGDIALSYADPSKAKEKLLWIAKRDLFTMCEDAWRWQKGNPEGYQTITKSLANN
ncbi:UDP-glucose 4-epimerase GalE [Salipaludibacillus keqinensis]|uniref:UDP-glucose 4-epimerase n=1 Tax=Salipaludibacillus keqinensis TaxID=2045207 RepID=A0A323TM24_9BACI|nr:UDP-glucose 4-epimerase GalE [Salipaludibacillus keqinensis]PYZ95084.1 UDP-glucose 4-epimerase GalE [Salipaludibacillus keqinensis]